MSSSARGTQILLVSGTVLLTAALYLAPQFKSESHAMQAAVNAPFSFDSMKEQARSSLSKADADTLARFEKADQKDSIVRFWDVRKVPALAAHEAEQIARAQGTEQNWNQAAYRYFDAFQSAPDSIRRAASVEAAIRCYGKVLELNPANLDARTDLGLCYVEGTGEPMKGIMMLRDVVAQNPEHENAQYNLGVLSMRSGQYEKAAERFEKVLAIHPARTEMYFMIGRAWMMKGDKEKALENFEKFKKSTADVAMINETNNLIQQLNNH